jgi:hypothetical protein
MKRFLRYIITAAAACALMLCLDITVGAAWSGNIALGPVTVDNNELTMDNQPRGSVSKGGRVTVMGESEVNNITVQNGSKIELYFAGV